jgi:hypothetical protein
MLDGTSLGTLPRFDFLRLVIAVRSIGLQDQGPFGINNTCIYPHEKALLFVRCEEENSLREGG